jgi:bacillolysin
MRDRGRRAASLWLLTLAAAGCLAAPETGSAAADAAAGEPDAVAFIGQIDRESAPAAPIPDDDASGVSDSIAVDADCTVDALSVDIDIRHPWRSDLEVTLHTPAGGEARLHAAGGTDPQDDLVGTYPVSLSPDDSLEAFVGLPAAGPWVMQVADVSGDDTGTFESWALHITCR